MVTEIPRKDWTDFCDSFSRRHEGWLVTLDAVPADGGPVEIGRNQALRGVIAQVDDTAPGQVSVIVGPDRDQHLTHTIDAPTSIRLEQSDAGADESLTIESVKSGTATLRFRVAALPEMVDGI
jgi:hypothetical protein